VLLRLSYLAVSSVFTVLRLLPLSGTEKDVEILALRHQLAIMQRQIDTPRLTGTDRVFLPRSCIGFRGSGCASCS
jgi:putative transposase